jgi:hypothetical protein
MPASELRPPRGPYPGLPIISITHVPAGPFGMNIFNDLWWRGVKITAGLG